MTNLDEQKENSTLSLIFKKLTDIYEDDEYDEDFQRPNATAYLKTSHFLENIANTSVMPTGGWISTSGDGEIRVEWDVGDKHLLLNVKDFDNMYIYYEQGDNYGGERNISFEKFKWYVEWLML